MAGVLIAIDQGTTNTKALLVDRKAQTLFRSSRTMTLQLPQAGFVEQDPWHIWSAVKAVLNDCLHEARAQGLTVEGLCFSNQRETALAWHRETGQPLAPAISWQCRRSTSVCSRLATHAAEISECTGLPLDPLLSASKWAWMMENCAGVASAAAENALCLGTVDTWLLFQLTGGRLHATDTTNASRTGLLNLATMAWDERMLAHFGVPRGALPALRPSSGSFGVCAPQEGCAGLAGLPILAAIGDSHAAMVGQGSVEPGTTKATYGTGSSVMSLTPGLVVTTRALSRTVAWTLPSDTLAEGTTYALEGNISMAGAAVQWVGEFLGLSDPAADAAALAEGIPDAGGVFLVPAMVGLGAPYWDTGARGLISGLERGHTAAHLARAAVESIAFQVADVFFAMREAAGIPLPVLLADGGASRNSSLMQFQADLLGVPVWRSSQGELSALGAAILGGLALGWWPDLRAAGEPGQDAGRFVPQWTAAQRASEYARWQQAVRRARLPEAVHA